MSYHPIMGITIFVIFLVLAFIIGKKVNIKKCKKNIKIIKNKEKSKTDAISPDAGWID